MTRLADLIAPGGPAAALVAGQDRLVSRAALRAGAALPGLSGSETVALLVRDPVDLIRALAALDGRVAGLLLLSHALEAGDALRLAGAAGATHLVTDLGLDVAGPDRPALLDLSALLAPPGSGAAPDGAMRQDTRWLLTTSGTTGLPKVVPHTLRSLTRSVYRFGPGHAPVWGLLYDPTRFAGLQVVLQALIGGGQLVVADTSAPLGDQVALLAARGVTHLSATPTLWRRILMVPGCRALPLRQVTLGGEIADAPTLAALAAAFPAARLSHIYASTEAGVGFSVTDGRPGFPRAYLDAAPGGVRLRIAAGLLRLRAPGAPPGETGPGTDAEGFVCSGDRVAVEGDRVLFLGRENGMINIGGVKVYPETVEAVVLGVPGVALAQISSKPSPVTGALVVAEVQLDPGADPGETGRAIKAACRARLPREAVPAVLRFVEAFRTNAAGKLVRTKG